VTGAAIVTPPESPGRDTGRPGIGDRELWACALQVMQQHKDGAWFHAAQRADALLADGDLDGHRTWMRILSHIIALEAAEARLSLQ